MRRGEAHADFVAVGRCECRCARPNAVQQHEIEQLHHRRERGLSFQAGEIGRVVFELGDRDFAVARCALEIGVQGRVEVIGPAEGIEHGRRGGHHQPHPTLGGELDGARHLVISGLAGVATMMACSSCRRATTRYFVARSSRISPRCRDRACRWPDSLRQTQTYARGRRRAALLRSALCAEELEHRDVTICD